MTQSNDPMAGPAGAPGQSLGYALKHHAWPREQERYELFATLAAEPTGEHFDPEEISLPVAVEGAGVDRLNLYPHSLHHRTYRVAAGRVILRDRRDKKIGFFTYGGTLHVTTQADALACRLESPSPIIELTPDEEDPHVLLAIESEALLARRRAAHVHEEDAFGHRLATADPLVLFLAVLGKLTAHFDHLAQGETGERFAQFLHTEAARQHRRDDLPAQVPPLDEIL